jgi:hypothetical protein
MTSSNATKLLIQVADLGEAFNAGKISQIDLANFLADPNQHDLITQVIINALFSVDAEFAKLGAVNLNSIAIEAITTSGIKVVESSENYIDYVIPIQSFLIGSGSTLVEDPSATPNPPRPTFQVTVGLSSIDPEYREIFESLNEVGGYTFEIELVADLSDIDSIYNPLTDLQDLTWAGLVADGYLIAKSFEALEKLNPFIGEQGEEGGLILFDYGTIEAGRNGLINVGTDIGDIGSGQDKYITNQYSEPQTPKSSNEHTPIVPFNISNEVISL